jgi:hypothetical protein
MTINLKWLTLLSALTLFCSIAYPPLAVSQEYFNQKEKYQFYKWIDHNGKTHYTQTPPPRGAAETVQRIKASGADASNSEAAKENLEKRRSQFMSDAEARNKAKEPKAKENGSDELSANCEKAKTNVSRLQSGGRIKIQKDGGETEFLDDSARKAQMDINQKFIDQHCK